MIDILTINKAQNYQLKVNVLQLGENFQAGGIIRKYAPRVIFSRKYAPQGGYFLGGKKIYHYTSKFFHESKLNPKFGEDKSLRLK